MCHLVKTKDSDKFGWSLKIEMLDSFVSGFWHISEFVPTKFLKGCKLANLGACSQV